MKLVLTAALTAVLLFAAPDTACSTPSPPHVIPNPVVRFVVWGPNAVATANQLESDWRLLFANGVLDRLSEYGVHGGTLDPSLTALPDLQPGTFDDGWVLETFLEEIDWAVATPGVAWVVVLPPGSSTTYLKAGGFAGYHFWGPVPYAVVVPNEVLISHEVYEMATDPDGLGYRIQGQEVGDLCEGYVEGIGGVTVQKVWGIKEGACL